MLRSRSEPRQPRAKGGVCAGVVAKLCSEEPVGVEARLRPHGGTRTVGEGTVDAAGVTVLLLCFRAVEFRDWVEALISECGDPPAEGLADGWGEPTGEPAGDALGGQPVLATAVPDGVAMSSL